MRKTAGLKYRHGAEKVQRWRGTSTTCTKSLATCTNCDGQVWYRFFSATRLLNRLTEAAEVCDGGFNRAYQVPGPRLGYDCINSGAARGLIQLVHFGNGKEIRRNRRVNLRQARDLVRPENMRIPDER